MSWLGLGLELCWGSSAGELWCSSRARATRPCSGTEQQQQQKLNCWRRSSWQFEADVDDPRTLHYPLAHRREDLEEAVLHVQSQSAKSGGRARPSARAGLPGSSRAWLCQHATTDSQMRPGTMIELGWVLDISMEQSMPSKDQHKPAQLHVQHCNVAVVAPQLWNTRKVASKPTTSSCSNAAVGEKVARRRIEPTNPHRRHGRRGRARSTAFAARETN